MEQICYFPTVKVSRQVHIKRHVTAQLNVQYGDVSQHYVLRLRYVPDVFSGEDGGIRQ